MMTYHRKILARTILLGCLLIIIILCFFVLLRVFRIAPITLVLHNILFRTIGAIYYCYTVGDTPYTLQVVAAYWEYVKVGLARRNNRRFKRIIVIIITTCVFNKYLVHTIKYTVRNDKKLLETKYFKMFNKLPTTNSILYVKYLPTN